MDLKSIVNDKSEIGVDMPILHPITGDELTEGDRKVTLKVMGADCKAYRGLSHKLNSEKLKKRMRGSQSIPKSEELEAEAIDLLTTSVIGWEGVQWEGKDLPFSKDNAKMILTECLWLREQVDRFVNDRRNFMGN